MYVYDVCMYMLCCVVWNIWDTLCILYMHVWCVFGVEFIWFVNVE